MTFSEALKRFRNTYNLKQKDVAEKMKMKQPLYQRYENGTTTPGINFVIKLADAYDVSADYLLGRSDEPRPQKFDAKTLALLRAMEDKFQTGVTTQ